MEQNTFNRVPERCIPFVKSFLIGFVFFLAFLTLVLLAGTIRGFDALLGAIDFFIFIEDRRVILVRRAEIAEKEKMYSDMQTEIMMSQIGPHFLYNALSSISSLCRMENATTAKNAVDKFAEYLRHNLDSVKQNPLIRFAKELEHIETYLWPEKMRFGDDLNVEYDYE